MKYVTLQLKFHVFLIQEDVVSELQERLETMKAEVRVLCVVFFGGGGKVCWSITKCLYDFIGIQVSPTYLNSGHCYRVTKSSLFGSVWAS